MLILVVGAAIANELLGLELEFLTPPLVRQMAIGSAGIFLLGLVAGVFGGAAGKVAGKRCPRCGKRVGKGQVYCRDHQKRAIEEMRDMDRTFEHSHFGRRGK